MPETQSYNPQVWRVNMSTRTLTREPVPEAWVRLGGRALVARFLLDEVPPACEPMGPYNKIIFAPGLLVGHMLSSCDRISIGGKSPLTRGAKEANAGGTTGLQMVSMGIKALVIEGEPAENELCVLHLGVEGARFDPADEIMGLGVYASARKLVEKYGDKVAISLVGPGAEMKLATAGIMNLDKDKVPSRIAARGGLGSVLAARGIRAVIFDAAGGQKPPIADIAAYREAQKVFNKAVIEHPQSITYRDYGTAAMVQMCQYFGSLPTRNYSAGQFEQFESISGETLRATMLERGGESNPTHACMPGCTIRCSNVFGGEDGKSIVSPLEYETIGLMGSNLGIGSLDAIARLNWQANDLGIDSIDTGAALGVAAEAGLMKFGDGERALELMDEIRRNTPLGRILGSGAGWAGKILGVEHVPVTKNQAMAAYEGRAIKGTGVTYATSPQGGDHTAGLTIRDKIDHLNPKGQVELSRTKQINMAGYDSLGACIFAAFGYAASGPDTIARLLNARYGWNVDNTILQSLGRDALKWEREFNRLAGFTAKDDRMPEWMTRTPLPPTGAVFDVPDEELDTLFNW